MPHPVQLVRQGRDWLRCCRCGVWVWFFVVDAVYTGAVATSVATGALALGTWWWIVPARHRRDGEPGTLHAAQGNRPG